MPTQRTTVYRHAELRRLLHPQSVAVIGASARAGSFGERVLLNQQNFAGRTYPVNARYEKIGEQICYPSVGALPEVVDCAVITAARDAVEEIVLDCVKAGVGGVIIFASGYAEMGREDRIAAQERLASISRETGLRIVGPNCIGVVNAVLDSRITFMNITPIPPPRPHAVGIISQSGALGMALAQAVVRGASFSHVMTSGNSCDVDMADFVSYLADDPACAAIACVFEGMASPERLLLAADYAWQRDKPLVVYKMATGEEGAAAAMSHTGSLAGSHASYRAVFQRAGAVLVENYESLVETASFFAKAPPPKATGAAVVAASGGAAIMAADRAEQYGVPMPQPGPELRELLVSRIPDFGAARNPCDVTGQILNDPESLNVCAGAFLNDPQYATLVVPMTYGYAASAARIPVYDRLAKEAGKIVCIAWQAEWLEGPGVKEAEEAERVALFRSMPALFAALAAWTWRAGKRAAQRETIVPTPSETLHAAGEMIAAAGGRTLTEREAKAALALYGVPVVGERLTQGADDAVAAAEVLGYPVVLKVESPDLPHKTEAGVIRLNLRDAAQVRAGYEAVMANARAVSPPPHINGVLVQPMVPQGVEMVVGARIDPLFGPLVVVGLGGILVEVLKDTALAPAPVTHADALALLGSLKGEKLLHGFRGAPAVDIDKLAEVICRISRFAADHRDTIAELDVNPLICAGDRIVAVDALIVPGAKLMRVAVVGAGIVGVSCALHLRRAGHDVTLLDPRPPGTATSFGNAGGIVTGAVVPNSTPALRRNLHRILLDRDNPVRLRWSYLPKLTPWLLHFLRNGSDTHVRRIAQALQPLVSRAYEAHRELIALSGADGIVRPVGWLKVYASEATFATTQYELSIMAEHGVRFDVLGRDEIRQLEPALAPRFEKALFQPDSAFVSSPHKLTEAYAAHFARIGGMLVQERVRGIALEPAGVVLDCEFGYRRFDAIVIAAGAWSKELARQVGDRVLLDTERGYHLNLEHGNAGDLRRAVVFPDHGGFVLAPMQDGIRLTSGVELAGLDAPPDFSRIRRLIPRALEVLPGLSAQVTRQWMGYRPSTPDSLPVIGRSPRSPQVYYAFGHQHLGLTLGPITGRLIAALVSGQRPEFDVSPYRIERF